MVRAGAVVVGDAEVDAGAASELPEHAVAAMLSAIKLAIRRGDIPARVGLFHAR